MAEAINLIEGNVRMMGGTALIVSTNVKLRMDGLPYSGQAQPSDSGAAVYFEFRKRPIAFACDKFERVECNLYSIGKTIEATRAIERWGSATMEQSFRGFMAIAEKAGGSDPYAVLTLQPGCSEEDLQAAYRTAAKRWHPDVPETGSYEKWQEIQEAYNLVAQNVRNGS